jgi:hypothetical protein
MRRAISSGTTSGRRHDCRATFVSAVGPRFLPAPVICPPDHMASWAIVKSPSPVSSPPASVKVWVIVDAPDQAVNPSSERFFDGLVVAHAGIRCGACRRRSRFRRAFRDAFRASGATGRASAA